MIPKQYKYTIVISETMLFEDPYYVETLIERGDYDSWEEAALAEAATQHPNIDENLIKVEVIYD